MADLGGTFDATGVDPAGDRSALPAGEYLAAIVKSEKRDSKSGGEYINLEYEVVDGPAKGRRFWSILNLRNANATAVEIAQRELSAICHAVGKLRISDTNELHGLPMLVKLKVQTDAQYGDKNVPAGFRAVGAIPHAATTQATQATQQAAAGGAKKGPWA